MLVPNLVAVQVEAAIFRVIVNKTHVCVLAVGVAPHLLKALLNGVTRAVDLGEGGTASLNPIRPWKLTITRGVTKYVFTIYFL